MSRYHPQTSTGHRVECLAYGGYRLSWYVDRYIQGSRLRYPTRYTRDTDEKGARRFAKRWGVKMPEEPKP